MPGTSDVPTGGERSYALLSQRWERKPSGMPRHIPQRKQWALTLTAVEVPVALVRGIAAPIGARASCYAGGDGRQ